MAENTTERIENITPSSLGFLSQYPKDLKMEDFLGDQLTKIDESTYSKATKESPRILGKLRFKIVDPDKFEGGGAPKTFSSLWKMVESGVLDCTNGDRITEFVMEWTSKYTNKSAEDQLRNASLQKEQGDFAFLPMTGHNLNKNVPEIIFYDTKNCLSPSEPTSTRLFNNFIARRGLVSAGESVIDLCAGTAMTGIIAGYMSEGRGKVYALDIMDEAIATAKHNIEMHQLKNVDVIKSDMLSELGPGVQVDKIFINPPFNPKMENGGGEFLIEAVHDFGYQVLTELFEQAEKNLKPTGAIYMLYEDIKVFPENMNAVEWIAKLHNEKMAKYSYEIKTLANVKRARLDNKGKPVLVPFVIYEISPTTN